MSAQTHIDRFLKKLFSRGEYLERCFRKLCDAGYPSEDLAKRLFAVCTFAGSEEARAPLINIGGVSNAELKKLTADLHSLADRIRRINKTPLAPGYDLLARIPTTPTEPHDVRAHMVTRFYEMLPGIMSTYGTHLEQFAKLNRSILKRRTFNHIQTMRLLGFVEQYTGSPSYEDLANLLMQGFVAAGGPEEAIPKFYTADALAKLNQRRKLPLSKNQKPRK